MPRTHKGIVTSTEPLNTYGSLEEAICQMRDHRPLDLNAEAWRKANPDGSYAEWRKAAKQCLATGMHYNPPACDLDAKTTKVIDRGEFTQEFIEFNTTPWFRVEGCFLLPKNAPQPLPAMVVFHAWGGPMMFGKERVVNVGRDHPALVEQRHKLYSDRYLAEEYVKRGYAVIVIDAYHFGVRAPRGIDDIPDQFEPFDLSIMDTYGVQMALREQLYRGVRELMWSGTTWAGLNFHDDAACIDYLQSRPEVDPERIGCTGVSGGGWRTDVLAALDDRIKASCSVGWMTTGDHQKVYNVAGGVGSFCLLPGVWDRMDIPDMTIMSAPAASMIVLGIQDTLFSTEGKMEAKRQIEEGFEWAGCSDNFKYFGPDSVHCYDAEIQAEALDWFDKHLKG